MSSHDDAVEKVNLPSQELVEFAHELRGSAGVILGALQELEIALGEDAAKHDALFAMAKRGVKRIANTANQLQRAGQAEPGSVVAS